MSRLALLHTRREVLLLLVCLSTLPACAEHVVATTCAEPDAGEAAVRYERVAGRTDYDGAVAACRSRGGELATEHGPGSLSAIVAACAVGLPSDRTMCWTSIPVDREGSALVLLVGPFQPVLAAEDPDVPIDAPQGHFAVCEMPGKVGP